MFLFFSLNLYSEIYFGSILYPSFLFFYLEGLLVPTV